MRNYELTLLLSPLLEEQEVNDAIQKTASLVQDKGGILGEQDVKGKHPLRVRVKNQQEGYLAVSAFSIGPEHLEEIEKTWKENPHILRYMIMQRHKKAPKTEAIPTLSKRTLHEGLPQEKPARSATQTLPEEKVDLKDIDEKLEEIFKEPS